MNNEALVDSSTVRLARPWEVKGVSGNIDFSKSACLLGMNGHGFGSYVARQPVFLRVAYISVNFCHSFDAYIMWDLIY